MSRGKLRVAHRGAGRLVGQLAFLGAIATGGQAAAAIFVVNNTADTNVANNGACTLREALNAANTNTFSADCQNQTGSASWDEIHVPAGLFILGSRLTVNDTVAFMGLSPGNSRIRGPGNTDQAILLNSGKYAELWDMIIEGGNGPAIRTGIGSGVMFVRSTIRDKNFGTSNQQTGGVLVEQNSTFYMVDSTITNSRSSVKGAAVFVAFDGSASVEYSTLDNNEVTQYGGAVHTNGYFWCFNSTISGNTASQGGGALHNSTGGTSLLQNCTITKNSTNGIKIVTGSVQIWDSIISDQTSGLSTCDGNLWSGGYNILGNMSGCTLTAGPGDLTNTSANLAPLANNGGYNRTHLPNPGSPAINGTPICPWDDQRRVLRPTSGPCDVGSVEQ